VRYLLNICGRTKYGIKRKTSVAKKLYKIRISNKLAEKYSVQIKKSNQCFLNSVANFSDNEVSYFIGYSI